MSNFSAGKKAKLKGNNSPHAKTYLELGKIYTIKSINPRYTSAVNIAGITDEHGEPCFYATEFEIVKSENPTYRECLIKLGEINV